MERVKDTGIGIPQKHLPRLGERFYRFDPLPFENIGGHRTGACNREAPGQCPWMGYGDRKHSRQGDCDNYFYGLIFIKFQFWKSFDFLPKV
jgi:hypothetical protein